jgi:hypothetical protein
VTEQQHDASPETLPCSARIQKFWERIEEMARLHLAAQKALPNHGPYDRSRSGSFHCFVMPERPLVPERE